MLSENTIDRTCGNAGVCDSALMALARAAAALLYPLDEFEEVYSDHGVRIMIPVTARGRAVFEPDCLAFAFGGDLFFRSRRTLTQSILRHELEHVKQYMQDGLAMPVLYSVGDAVFGYDNNPYENAARAAE